MAGKYLPFEQDGVEYNLYEMPKGFVIKGNLDLSEKGLTELPDLSEVVVEVFFCCNKNDLVSLKGAPKEVGGDFWCQYNQLTSLDGCSPKIRGSFSCINNKLLSLFGVSALKEHKRMYCDDTLGEKYGFYNSENEGFTFKELSESTHYKSEVAADNVRRRQAQERVEKRERATEQTKAAFDAWLKNKGIESPER